MDGVHDLGGRQGFGKLPIEQDEPVFHHDWEGRVIGIRNGLGAWRLWNIDYSRHSVETLPPVDYLSMTYYEKWLASAVNMAVARGLLTWEEVRSGEPAPGAPLTPPLTAEGFRAFMPVGRPSARDSDAAPRFAVGDRVRTARYGHSGHTRLPGYMRDRVGEVILLHGAHVFPDSNAKLEGEAPQHLYAVRFDGGELWGPEAEPGLTVSADLWESYLEPA